MAGKESQSSVAKGWRDMQRSFFATLKAHPKLQYVLYASIVLIIALLYFGAPPFGKRTPNEAQASASPAPPDATASLEERLTATLSRIAGVGRVEVLISYESSPEMVPAMSVDKQSETDTAGGESQRESSEPFTLRGEGSDGPFVLMEIEPRVRGVIVVAEGAGDIAVRMQLQNAVQTALDIPASKVDVLPMAPQPTPAPP